jgi:hypothetical protein|tara:strand:- start:299 stop:568 length:270 start_codon:yes stop_codon:yes gene_type:complete
MGGIMACPQTNVQFIARYIFNNPGARHNEILRALCAYKEKPWRPGLYTAYMTTSRWGPGYAGRCWRKDVRLGGYILTLEGLTKLVPQGE